MASGLITLGVPGSLTQLITGGLSGSSAPPPGASNGLITLGIPANLTHVITSGLDVAGIPPVPGNATGGPLVHTLPEWFSLAPYKYALADLKRRREEEEIMVLIDG